jgi:hypothetical protein
LRLYPQPGRTDKHKEFRNLQGISDRRIDLEKRANSLGDAPDFFSGADQVLNETRISASKAARDRNSSINAHQINPKRSLIGSEYQPIRDRGQPFWVCGGACDQA